MSIAPTVKMTHDHMRTSLRPSRLFAGPLHAAPTAASAIVDDTTISCCTLSRSNPPSRTGATILIMAPETTPVS
eukprot:2969276-Prymnesium_polylepis.1